MQETENLPAGKSTKAVVVGTQSEASKSLLNSLRQEKLTTMSLLDESASALNSVLQGICKKGQESPEIRTYSMENVENMIKLAGGIATLVKAKTDAIKVAVDIHKEYGDEK